jgi:hypothetical protein
MTFVMHHRTVAEFACFTAIYTMVLPGPQPGEERLIEGTLRLLDMPRPPRSRRRRVDVWLTVSGWAWTAYFGAFAFAALWMLL